VESTLLIFGFFIFSSIKNSFLHSIILNRECWLRGTP
jgi:hypothetical protein